MVAEPDADFLQYHEPEIIQLLTLISFFFFLSLAQWASDKIFKAGLIGQIIVGLVYGRPVGNILHEEWQKTFVDLGYIGLILIIFGGGLTVRLDLLKKNFVPSFVAAVIGVTTPIALCYGLLYAAFGYGAIETFIIGAALSTTSLGTTFIVIGRAVQGIDFSKTRVGIILISAAVFDDVSGLIIVIRNIGSAGSINVGWLIGRPVVASVAMGVASPLLSKFVLGPLFRWHVEHHFVRFKHVANIVLMVLVLCAFISVAAFAGASVLYGSFLAGTFLSSIPCVHPDAPFMVLSREHGETAPGKTPNFIHTFEKYILGAQTYILEPMFFASIGFAIPFKALWTGEAVWRGLVFSLLMVFGKAVVGAVVPIWEVTAKRPQAREVSLAKATWRPATLLGMAMVARGEIGLLIIQIGLNETEYMSKEAFVTAAWAIVLNTILGPVCVGFLLESHGQTMTADPQWGIQESEVETADDDGESDQSPEGRGSRWTSRRHSRMVDMSQLPTVEAEQGAYRGSMSLDGHGRAEATIS
ncbi:sodium-hydrogen antiporter [Ophiocordyceps sinensis CO18]|uniref:Sodium-hydrogen antiporter n=1 Tax=Ophiocordyceps sinensis (strain Co18 / CGMCC 3.14243) TaxID=911162 RepID=T5ACX8_OPHSC|nr:sodium-hydrogen antiporter [Ophiocordyceps sinensis CO18]